ncbi:uncharacterized protein MELLADRAFT_112010 [Melampsora larici-populina 98AG31]|uniref:Uncharacterized protein n=1 Tax=Melampsora larici-populina (strain 98AG31 / pathotype 3-4-7) TaxID=747676 RepID=F4S534_MELLP|nr:uncharacterized protein MELLADRAFT_112010 [Melampsora larici-populina 98AG31]EGG00275.1 hypothetical protein MELLADRAFT_112010 [Melampsora larici-populina 98AG31]
MANNHSRPIPSSAEFFFPTGPDHVPGEESPQDAIASDMYYTRGAESQMRNVHTGSNSSAYGYNTPSNPTSPWFNDWHRGMNVSPSPLDSRSNRTLGQDLSQQSTSTSNFNNQILPIQPDPKSSQQNLVQHPRGDMRSPSKPDTSSHSLRQTSKVVHLESDEEDGNEITYELWQHKISPVPLETRGGKKAKNSKKKGGKQKKIKMASPRFTPYKPPRPVRKEMSFRGSGWIDFVNQLFTACDSNKAGSAERLAAAERHENLDIEGWINKSKNHKKAQHALITDNKTFKAFAEEALASPVGTSMGFRMVQPERIDHVEDERAAALSGNEISAENSSDNSDTDTDGSERVHPTTKCYKILYAKFEEQFKAGENVVPFPNPANAQEVLPLNTGRIRIWADAWANKTTGVNETSPPMSRHDFEYVLKSDWERVKAEFEGKRPSLAGLIAAPAVPPTTPAIHTNYNYYIPFQPGGSSASQPYGFSPAPPGLGQNTQGSVNATQPLMIPPTPLGLPPHTATREDSPAPEPHGGLENFFEFAQIKPDFLTRMVLYTSFIMRLPDRLLGHSISQSCLSFFENHHPKSPPNENDGK